MCRARLIAILLPFLCSACAIKRPLAPLPEPVVSRYQALVRVDGSQSPLLQDDLDAASLRQAALYSKNYYDSLPGAQLFVIGQDTYTAKDLSASMASLVRLLERSGDSSEWLEAVKREFAVYQSIGTDSRRSVTFSSYYEPIIPASRKKDSVYQFPLYARPPDLLDVDLSLFDPNYQGARVVGRQEGRALVPYHTRAEIDGKRILGGDGLELAWAKDAFDVLDLQIEGSGWLDFGEGEPVRIRYDGDNGKRYRSVGQYLISSGRIKKKRFSREAMREYLRKHPRERQKVLNVNERYIFFRLDTSTSAPFAYGNLRVPLTAGRSMATDPKLFPKGALAWVQVDGQKPIGRFMLNQDEGGAIQGPGRVDIFAGKGEEGLKFAAKFWHTGKLYFLVKKKPAQTAQGL